MYLLETSALAQPDDGARDAFIANFWRDYHLDNCSH